MDPLYLLRLPFRALDDLHELAEESRRADDGRRTTAETLEELTEEVRKLRVVAEGLTAEAADLRGSADDLRGSADGLRGSADGLGGAADRLDGLARKLTDEVDEAQEQFEPVSRLARRLPGSGS